MEMEMKETPGVVVGVDGSENSVQALRWAVDYARVTGKEVRVISAFAIPWTIFFTPTATGQTYSDKARETLDSTIASAFPNGADMELNPQVIQNRPELALAVASKTADILVVGSQGHGLLPGVHIGSVANYCVQHAECPVVVVRS